jgi:hypothetical protein
MISSTKLSLFQAAAILGLCVTAAFVPLAEGRDILRPGSGGGAAPQGKAAAGGANTAGSAAAAQAGKNARDVLARTSLVAQSMQRMQNAARGLRVRNANTGVLPGLAPVPNGLATGGLQVAPGVPRILTQPAAGEDASLWVGAKLPTQSVVKERTVVNIEQTKAQAVLNWQPSMSARRRRSTSTRKVATRKRAAAITGSLSTRSPIPPACRARSWVRSRRPARCI